MTDPCGSTPETRPTDVRVALPAPRVFGEARKPKPRPRRAQRGTWLAFAVAAAGLSPPVSAQLAPPNAVGVTWGHIHMNVANPAEHVRIWVEHFGAEEVPLEIPTVSLPNTILMFNARTPTGGTAGSSVDHFGFSVPDVGGFLDRWRAAGLEVEQEFEGFGGGPQAYLRFPDGIRVELDQVPSLEVPAVPYHVHLYSESDPEALRDWFVEHFEATPRERGFNPFTADVPGMNVSFSQAEGLPEPSVGRAVDHVGFEVDGLADFVSELRQRGLIFDVDYRVLEQFDVGVAFFTDASGTRWELSEGLDELVEQALSGR